MKPKIIKSSQLCITAFECECECVGDTYEINHYSSWSERYDKECCFECEECGQKWILPKNMDIVLKFKRRSK